MTDRSEYQKAYREDHKAERAAYHKAYDAERRPEKKEYDRARPQAKRHPNLPREIVGIDGEGLTEERARKGVLLDFIGPMPQIHKYLYMAAWGHTRKVGDLDLDPSYADGREPAERTKACFDFLLSLPQEALLLGFSLGYDYTKILEGLPDGLLYEIARPELRQGKNGPRARLWGDWQEGDYSGHYKVNYVKGKLSLSKLLKGVHALKCNRAKCRGCKVFRKCTVWDIFAFFQMSFIKACKTWKVVSEKEYNELAAMKAKRSTFTRDEWETVKEYCGQECRKMATLGERLLSAHEDAGLKLTSYYGAGSTAARMLKVKFDAKRFLGVPLPAMNEAIASGFFGGRFEVSRIGPVRQKCYSYDIASAYPYQFTFLPCLACGKWKLEKGRGLRQKIERADAALIRYRLPVCKALDIDKKTKSSPIPWGPFPLRAYGLNTYTHDGEDTLDSMFPGMAEYPTNGSILYPVSSGGGWVYKDEFLTAQKHFPNVEAVEAWIYTRHCSHEPFNDSTGERETMPQQYLTRLAWGKEGRGIVVKLGCNSCYGKAAQSVGNAPPFQSFLFAGIVTSGCRAQLLEAMATASDPRMILGTATDGILSLEDLTLPVPRDTGTAVAAGKAGKVALGAWESKDLDEGIMLIRPGIAFPLNAEIEAEVKARGIGKAVLASHRAQVLEQWEKHPGRTYKLSRDMFFGMKSATDGPTASKGYASRRANYGSWAKQPTTVSYSPFPKRPRRGQGDGVALRTWAFGPEVTSAPYERLLTVEAKEKIRAERRGMVNGSADGDAEKRWETLLGEQPDRDEDDMGFRDEG